MGRADAGQVARDARAAAAGGHPLRLPALRRLHHHPARRLRHRRRVLAAAAGAGHAHGPLLREPRAVPQLHDARQDVPPLRRGAEGVCGAGGHLRVRGGGGVRQRHHAGPQPARRGGHGGGQDAQAAQRRGDLPLAGVHAHHQRRAVVQPRRALHLQILRHVRPAREGAHRGAVRRHAQHEDGGGGRLGGAAGHAARAGHARHGAPGVWQVRGGRGHRRHEQHRHPRRRRQRVQRQIAARIPPAPTNPPLPNSNQPAAG
mmetsp:Transcript_36669/g.92679  ORF Transcript_36669/g.92679 Transcript_36669/m.92679 type:complete len:259 (+) Transcript_36669:843-1619(+)